MRRKPPKPESYTKHAATRQMLQPTALPVCFRSSVHSSQNHLVGVTLSSIDRRNQSDICITTGHCNISDHHSCLSGLQCALLANVANSKTDVHRSYRLAEHDFSIKSRRAFHMDQPNPRHSPTLCVGDSQSCSVKALTGSLSEPITIRGGA